MHPLQRGTRLSLHRCILLLLSLLPLLLLRLSLCECSRALVSSGAPLGQAAESTPSVAHRWRLQRTWLHPTCPRPREEEMQQQQHPFAPTTFAAHAARQLLLTGTVPPFVPDVAPLIPRTYAHVVPLSTPLAHMHVPLHLLPSELVPASWSVRTDLGPLLVQRVYADPLLLTMHTILTEFECRQLVADAEVWARTGPRPWQRSPTGLPEPNARTSEFVDMRWHPVVRRLYTRVAAVSGMPEEHIEMGTVLRYRKGQQFITHHDCRSRSTETRRLTLVVPLDSAPGEIGGATTFPLLNFSFAPRAGAAIIWRNHQPAAENSDDDPRVVHSGDPPQNGTKYAINMWIRQDPLVHTILDETNNTDYLHPITVADPNADVNLVPDAIGRPELPLRRPGALCLLTTKYSAVRKPWLIRLDTGLMEVTPIFTNYSTTEPTTTAKDATKKDANSTAKEPLLLLHVPDFLTLLERQTLLSSVYGSVWRDSLLPSGRSPLRTTSSVWLYNSSVQTRVARRIAALVGTPATHVVATAITRFRIGEFYRRHQDSNRFRSPDRILTVHIPLLVAGGRGSGSSNAAAGDTAAPAATAAPGTETHSSAGGSASSSDVTSSTSRAAVLSSSRPPVDRTIDLSGASSSEPGGHIWFPHLHLRLPQLAGSAYIWRNYSPGSAVPDARAEHEFEAPLAGSIVTLTAWVYPYDPNNKPSKFNVEDREKRACGGA